MCATAVAALYDKAVRVEVGFDWLDADGLQKVNCARTGDTPVAHRDEFSDKAETLVGCIERDAKCTEGHYTIADPVHSALLHAPDDFSLTTTTNQTDALSLCSSCHTCYCCMGLDGMIIV